MSENIEINFVGDGFDRIHQQLTGVEQHAQRVGRIPFALTTTGAPAPGSRGATSASPASPAPSPTGRVAPVDRSSAAEARPRTAESRDDARYAAQLNQVRDERIRLERDVNRSIERELRDRVRAEPAPRRFQPTERGMTDSRRAMAAATEFQSEIAALAPSARLAAIRQRIHAMDRGGREPPVQGDPEFLEYHRLQRQAASTQRTTAHGRFMAAPSGARMAALGAFAVHEVVGALQDQIRAGHQLQLAGNRREYMQALADQARAGWSGPIAGTIGGIMDLFGAGPESRAFRIESQGRAMEAQDARMAAAITLQAERNARQYNRGGRVGAIKADAALRHGQLLNEMSANTREQDDLVRRLDEKEKYLEVSTNPIALATGPLGLLANSQISERDKVRGDARTALEERLKELRLKQQSNIENATQLAKEEAESIELYRRNVKSNIRASEQRGRGNNFGAKIEELNFGLFSAMYRGDAEGTQEAVQNFREFLATTKRDNEWARYDVTDSAAISEMGMRGFSLMSSVAGANMQRRQALRQLPDDPLFNKLGGQALRDAINAAAESQIEVIRDEFSANTRLRFMGASGRGYEGKMDDIRRRIRNVSGQPLTEDFTKEDQQKEIQSLLVEAFGVKTQRFQQEQDVFNDQNLSQYQLNLQNSRIESTRRIAPILSQAGQIAAGARSREMSLRRQGLGRQADIELGLGRQRLDAFQQSFFDSFQSQELDPRFSMASFDPRFQTDPSSIQGELDAMRGALNQRSEAAPAWADALVGQISNAIRQATIEAWKTISRD